LRFSVALCTYNGADFVRAQLWSVLAQSPGPAEIVVCDDGSTDGTPDILREIAAGASVPFRIERNEARLGSTGNFEKAIGLCAGEVIVLADQDDVWLPGKLDRLAAAFARPDVTGAFSDAELTDEGLNDLGIRLWDTLDFRPPPSADAMLAILQRRNVVTGATFAFRSEVAAMARPIPASPLFLHDWWIALIAASTGRLVPIAEPLIRYRQHGGQQVGAALAGPASRSGPDIGREAAYRSQAEALRAAVERLEDPAAPLRPRPGALAALEGQLAHLEARRTMPASRLGRLPLVARELLRGRYGRWSRGLASAARDLAGGGA
jgi:hypothetical protein